MRKNAATAAFLFAIIGCSGPVAQDHLEPANPRASFFVGLDPSKLPEPARTAVRAAEADINLVLAGRSPVCAESPESGESDGGTLHYRCQHYELTVMRTMAQVGDTRGYMYGPVLTFPNQYPVSYVRFFTSEQLEALPGSRDGR